MSLAEVGSSCHLFPWWCLCSYKPHVKLPLRLSGPGVITGPGVTQTQPIHRLVRNLCHCKEWTTWVRFLLSRIRFRFHLKCTLYEKYSWTHKRKITPQDFTTFKKHYTQGWNFYSVSFPYFAKKSYLFQIIRLKVMCMFFLMFSIVKQVHTHTHTIYILTLYVLVCSMESLQAQKYRLIGNQSVFLEWMCHLIFRICPLMQLSGCCNEYP